VSRPAARLAALLAAVTLVACIELSGPGDGVFSIEPLQLQSPGIALGDSMRDTLGRALPPTVIARDKDGNIIETAAARFFTLDRGVIVLPGGYLLGDSLRSDARIVGEVGGLQTLPVTVDVVKPPATVLDSGGTRVIVRIPVSGPDILDTITTRFGLRVLDVDSAGVPSWPVRFTIISSTVVPLGPDRVPVAIAEGTSLTRIDTTVVAGYATRQLRLLPYEMNEAHRQQLVEDTVRVRVSTTVRNRVVDSLFTFLIRPR
jgi:hypothetical protein